MILRGAPVEYVDSVRKILSTLERCEVAKLDVSGTKCGVRKLVHVTDVQKSIMGLFNSKICVPHVNVKRCDGTPNHSRSAGYIYL